VSANIHDLLKRIEALEERLEKKEKKAKYLTIKQLAKKTGYSVSTLYDKVKLLELNKHYFKPNKVKLLFDESAIDFLIKGEDRNGESLQEKRQSICLDQFLL